MWLSAKNPKSTCGAIQVHVSTRNSMHIPAWGPAAFLRNLQWASGISYIYFALLHIIFTSIFLLRTHLKGAQDWTVYCHAWAISLWMLASDWVYWFLTIISPTVHHRCSILQLQTHLNIRQDGLVYHHTWARFLKTYWCTVTLEWFPTECWHLIGQLVSNHYLTYCLSQGFLNLHHAVGDLSLQKL